MAAVRKLLLFVLAAPLVLALVAFDVVKMPLFAVFVFPIWGLLDVIALLRGEDTCFPGIYVDSLTMGTQLGMEIVGIPTPAWMNRL